MLRLAIVTAEGKTLKLEEIPTAVELQQVLEQARNLMRACERLAASKMPAQTARKVPYS